MGNIAVFFEFMKELTKEELSSFFVGMAEDNVDVTGIRFASSITTANDHLEARVDAICVLEDSICDPLNFAAWDAFEEIITEFESNLLVSSEFVPLICQQGLLNDDCAEIMIERKKMLC